MQREKDTTLKQIKAMRMCVIMRVMGFLLTGLVAGCGVRESTTYYVPNWTPSGQIVARRYYMKTSTNIMSNSHLEAQRSEVVLMNADGSGETVLFTDDENSIELLAMSPSGNYLAYIDSEGKLNLFSNAGGWHRVWDVNLSEEFTDIRFNLAENLLILSAYRSHFKVISLSNPNQIVYQNNEFQGAPGIWGYGNQIFYLNNDERKLNIVDVDTTNVTRQDVLFFPHNFDASKNTLSTYSYSDSVGWYVARLNLDTLEQVVTTFSYSPYESNDFIDIKVSPDGKRLVMTYDSVENVGIYVLDSDVGKIVQLR